MDDRQRFLAAFDDHFQRVLIEHCHRHPPMVVNESTIIKKIDMRPGALNVVTPDEMKRHLSGDLVFVAND